MPKQTTTTSDWTITNPRNLDIIGNTEHPSTTPTATLLLLHGFKGYKDYGFIPVLAQHLSRAGILVHRFNFSCSGMTNDIESFARPDLFALDTWTRQVEDTRCVIDAINDGTLEGANLPMFIAGHSRGGATTLLAAARSTQPTFAGVITINAVDRCCGLSDEAQHTLLNDGYITTPSARTGQELRINASWLQEQLDDPDAHNILNLSAHLNPPALIMQGTDDQAIDPRAGQRIANALSSVLLPIKGANHVLNTANPAPHGGSISPQLDFVRTQIESFVNTNSTKTPI
tara:strand:- start:220854 stop:221714 length:861 start_codon:yes stop_codon:yes gene_type:complete